ncbi:GNAT family N-acetyltransferase [Deinococcus altitudinis]|uniref:GNAT family N-acetyltransferase n=1 Tax=Deinococcus altitudinis TaxID=468914 RepID=UPI003891E583
MLADHWPLMALELVTPRLRLRPPNDDELAAIAEVAAAGVHGPGEQPFLTPWTHLPPGRQALHVIQGHWASRGGWSVASWSLQLGVFHEGRPMGMVCLRAQEFPVLREVRTWSWLGLDFHGRGFGTEARHALLHLAFGELGAVSALTEVFQDNAASQGVSRKLGYRHDGVSRDVLNGEVVVSDRLRLDREDWQNLKRPPVVVRGSASCLPFFLGDD